MLETHATAKEKYAESGEVGTTEAESEQFAIWQEKKKPRPRRLPGYTFLVDTPLGKTFITINENGGGQPFEVFVNTSKAGSETAAVSEAIGRLASYILRLASPVPPRDRLKRFGGSYRALGGVAQ